MLFGKKKSPAAPFSFIPAVHERWLCLTLVVAKILLFFRRYNEMGGSDAGSHLDMVRELTWSHPMIDIKAMFYSYHPPLGFLLPRLLYLAGLTDRVAVQIVALLFSLTAFFLLRATLKHLKLLAHPVALAFLYLFAAMPMQQYLQTSMNLDVFILAYVCLALYCSVRLWWGTTPSRTTALALHLVLWASVVLALYTKFSGVLVPFIPLLALLLSLKRKITKSWAAVFLTLMLAACATLPYYTYRYYRTEGTFFPNNGNWLNGGAQQGARDRRDADPAAWFRNVLFSNPFVHGRLTWRDDKEIRVWNAWWDTWVGIFATKGWNMSVGLFYLYGATIGCVAGALAFLFRRRGMDVLWRRFGWMTIGIAGAFLASFLSYLWKNPDTSWGPVKGIYVAPIMLAAAFLLSQALFLPVLSRALRTGTGQRLLLGGLAAYILTNLTLPVYV